MTRRRTYKGEFELSGWGFGWEGGGMFIFRGFGCCVRVLQFGARFRRFGYRLRPGYVGQKNFHDGKLLRFGCGRKNKLHGAKLERNEGRWTFTGAKGVKCPSGRNEHPAPARCLLLNEVKRNERGQSPDLVRKNTKKKFICSGGPGPESVSQPV